LFREALILRARLPELASVFLKLGLTAFGGPAAHVAMIEAEVVDRQQWLTREHLLDLYSMTNLIPGPNSTELVMHIGQERAGWKGLVVAGLSFILPAMTIVWLLAISYTQYQSLPNVGHIFAGIKPVLLGLIGQALWKLGRSAIKDWLTGWIAVLTLVACAVGVNEVFWLLLMGIAMMLIRNWPQLQNTNLSVAWWPLGLLSGRELSVFGLFLKIGLVMYGGGYVLIAFLQRELVDRQHLLTSQQLLDAVAIGQITPGPLFTTATFVGYLLAGHGGAIAATIGIFLPGFVLVGLLHPVISKMRQSAGARAFLEGINPAAWGLMAIVSWQLATTSIHSWLTGLMAIASGGILLRWRINSLWLVGIGGTLGWLLQI
jgi:chromate transporter